MNQQPYDDLPMSVNPTQWKRICRQVDVLNGPALTLAKLVLDMDRRPTHPGERHNAAMRCAQTVIDIVSSNGGNGGCAAGAGSASRTTTTDEIDSLRLDLARWREAAEKLASEVQTWRQHAEDQHEANYGHCRPNCSKCAMKRFGWAKAKCTDTNPTARALVEGRKAE